MLATSLKVSLWGIGVSLILGLGCLTVGARGNSWWKSSIYDMEQGLTNFRIRGLNVERRNLFHFKLYNLDNILILIIVSCIFAVLSFICLLALCCFKDRKSTWTIGTGILICLTFISSIFGISAVLYAEVFTGYSWKHYEHGWSIVIAWAGAVFCILAWLLSCNAGSTGRPKLNQKYFINEKKTTSFRTDQKILFYFKLFLFRVNNSLNDFKK
ncbi:uncharacterized protein LOC100208018 isoform X2 [Hydra vulgaris]|uniref:Uncharacterized protein LOC100208018 isoform X2 n=1 Tax=Hydra vulgaris TaxID=6087 RepID=A0ABM4C288_HYDVU